MSCDQLWIGEKKGLIIDGVAIVLVHTEQGFSAFDDRCPHAGALMSEGLLAGNTLSCARHHWQFNADSGNGINPRNTCLQGYPLMIDDEGMIWIELGDAL